MDKSESCYMCKKQLDPKELICLVCCDCATGYKKSDQIGGDHYSKAIEPIEYIQKNNLGFCEGNVIKYVSRYKEKNGKEDLLKAKHYIDMIIDHEYGGNNE